MCFSFEVSITTFVVSWSIGLYLLNKDLNESQRHNVIFLLIFSSIQFLDSILWAINLKKNKINFLITSYIIPFVLSLQIVYNLFVINRIRNPFVILFVFIYIIGSFIGFNGYSVKSKNMFESPIWGGTEIAIINMLLFFAMITYGRIGFKGEKLHTLIIGLVSFALPYILFDGGYGSIWCSLANILAFYYLYSYSLK